MRSHSRQMTNRKGWSVHLAKKRLGLPRCITNTGLYAKGILAILVSSLTVGVLEGNVTGAVWSEMTLTETNCCPNSSYPGICKEVNPSCSYSAGKVHPQSSGYCQICTVKERRPWPWREHIILAQSNLITSIWSLKR